MYTLGRSTRNQKPHAEIVSVDRIVLGCHLAPKMGSIVPTAWVRGNAMTEATDFFLNRYANFHLYELLRPGVLEVPDEPGHVRSPTPEESDGSDSELQALANMHARTRIPPP